MPIILKPNQMYYKDLDTEDYKEINVLAEEATATKVAEINTAGTTAKNTAIAAIQEKANEVTSQLASAGELEGMLAGAFSASTNYTAGQYVIQSVTVGGNTVNKLFRFTADHAAGEWIGTDVVEIKLGDDVTDLKSANDNLLENLYAEHAIKNIPCVKKYDACTIGRNYTITYQENGIAVYLFDVSNAVAVIVESGNIYGWFASEPVISTTTTVDSERHIETLNNTKLSVISGAVYLAVVSRTGEPSVTYDFETTQEQVDSFADDISELNAQCGDVYYDSTKLVPFGNITDIGIRNTEIGYPLNEYSTTSYPSKVYSVTAGKRYEATTVQGTSGNYPYYAYFTDDNKICKGKFLAIGTTTEIATAPEGSTRLYIMGYQNVNGTSATEKTMVSIQDQIDALREDGADNASIKKGKEMLDSIRPIIIGYNDTNKFLNFSWCTDIHTNGVYAYNDYVAMNNIRVFALLNDEKWLDFAAFGGDLYSSYGLTREEALAEIDNSMQIMRPSPIPFYMVKGNHELNTKTLHVADPNNLDWNNVTYYIIDPSNIKEYTEITESQWDGVQRLYYGNADPESFITRSQWYMIFQNHVEGHFNESDPYGGYFYKDFDAEKVRVIVLNCYDTDRESYSFKGEQVKFIAENALNFSDKPDRADWGVLFFVHNFYSASEVQSVLSGNTPEMYNAMTAFASGTDYNKTIGNVSITANFSEQGAGKIIAVIHGHQHADTYDNTYGWNNIGTIAGFSNISNVGTYDEFGFDVFTVDSENKILYETRFGRGTSRAYNYGNSSGIIT